jgi:hypothetical protein
LCATQKAIRGSGAGDGLVHLIGLPEQLRQPRNVDGDPPRLVLRQLYLCGPVLPIDRIKFDAPCAKCIFDSFRHYAPVRFGPLICWNCPYG